MAHEIIMPKAGMAMEEGTIVRWLKEIGDEIRVGDPVLEIETDKVTMEVEAEYEGVLLARLKEEGDVVPVIETIGYIGAAGELPPEAPAPAPETASEEDRPRAGRNAAPAQATTPQDDSAGVRATPAARRLAAEKGIRIEDVPPGGKWNAVTASEVEAFAGGSKMSPLARKVASIRNLDTSGIAGSGPGGRIMRRDLPSAAAHVSKPLAGMRKVIAERMSEANTTIPSVTLNRTAEVSRLVEFRAWLNRREDVKVSLNDLIVKAAAAVLPDHPVIRTRLQKGGLTEMPGTDIGIAVAVEEGLMVPVVRNASELSLEELSRTTRDLARRARERKLLPDEMTGGVFSVSNLGMYGITTFNPIINLPQAAILGVGMVEDRLFLENGLLEQKKLLHLSLTIDHRIIDGAAGALFLRDLAERLEAPYNL